MQIETFPFRLADNKWHNIALGFSHNHVEVYIDCNKVYSRAIHSFDMDPLSYPDMHTLSLWIGQRRAQSRHAYFNVSMLLRP